MLYFKINEFKLRALSKNSHLLTIKASDWMNVVVFGINSKENDQLDSYDA